MAILLLATGCRPSLKPFGRNVQPGIFMREGQTVTSGADNGGINGFAVVQDKRLKIVCISVFPHYCQALADSGMSAKTQKRYSVSAMIFDGVQGFIGFLVKRVQGCSARRAHTANGKADVQEDAVA